VKVVLVCSERIGTGDDELGAKLMGSFLYSLARTPNRPDAVVFMNGGVRLTCEGSSVLADIRLLAADGADVYSCGTCLDWLGLRERLAVGQVGNMNDTAAMFTEADDVVTVG